MGQGTSSNFWNSGNDGVRITVVDASSGTAVYIPKIGGCSYKQTVKILGLYQRLCG